MNVIKIRVESIVALCLMLYGSIVYSALFNSFYLIKEQGIIVSQIFAQIEN